MAIGLGFDSINGEYNRRTMSRILAQPIYRDALLFGKFLAGLATISISLVTLWLLVIGFGLLRLGVPPSGEEIGRLFDLPAGDHRLCRGLAGAGHDCSRSFFRSTATAALVALGLWLFLALLWPALAQMLGEVISPSDIRFAQLGLPTPDTLMWQQGLSRLSPGTLYGEAVVAMLNPDAQSMTTLAGAVPGPHRLAAAARPEHPAGLAADRQPDRRHDPALRDRLRGVPAARGEGVDALTLELSQFVRPDYGLRTRGRQAPH